MKKQWYGSVAIVGRATFTVEAETEEEAQSAFEHGEYTDWQIEETEPAGCRGNVCSALSYGDNKPDFIAEDA